MYEPCEDSKLIKKHIKDYAFGNVLDMGTGSGILAIEAKKYADNVIAVDIDSDVIKKLKIQLKDHKIKFIQSDLFDCFKKDNNLIKKFDLIVFNPPYLPQDKGIEDRALYGGKKGHEIIEGFLGEVKNYLKKDAKILLLFSSITNKKKINELITNNHLKFKLIDKQRIFFETLYVYVISA